MKYTKDEVKRAHETLSEVLNPQDTIYCVLRHVSRSGMSRSISLFVAGKDERILDITYWVSRVLDNSIDHNHGGIKIGGCGMDMGFALVYNLGRKMYPGGWDTIAACGTKEDGKTPKYWRNKPMAHETDGGFAYKSQWL